MSPWIAILIMATLVALRLFFLTKQLWAYPLNHGTRYFLGVEVEDGFYEGRGIEWLKAYRAMLAIQHAILAGTATAIVLSGRWTDAPLLAPVDVGSFFLLIGGFALWARQRVACPVPRAVGVAVSLRPRRLRDYLSWRLELLLVGLLAVCWGTLALAVKDFTWATPVLFSYAAMGLLPVEILLARNSFPLPADRAEEHESWFDAGRRHSLRLIDRMRWFLALTLAAHTARLAAPAHVWLYWTLLVVSIVMFGAMTAELILGGERVRAQGRLLRPPGSWASPFAAPRLMPRGWLAWAIGYCGGMAVLFAVLARA